MTEAILARRLNTVTGYDTAPVTKGRPRTRESDYNFERSFAEGPTAESTLTG